MDRLTEGYGRLLSRAMTRRRAVLGWTVAVLVAAAAVCAPRLGTGH